MLSALGFRCLVWIVRLMPFGILYFLSDLFSFFLQHIIQYRKKTIRKNLQQAFPDLDEQQLKATIKAVYKNLTDTTLESLKGPTLSEKQLKKRMFFKNPELLPKNKHVLLIGGHQGNWEWGGLAVSLWFEQQVVGIYKPMKNKSIDAYFRKIRAKKGLRLISMRGSLKFLREKNPPTILVLIADQSPANAKTSYWTSFFNKMSAFSVGPEKIAVTQQWPVYYYEVQRKKRGYYEVTFHLLAKSPADLKDGEIITRYRDALEKSIRLQPGSWLWSHKRWKKTIPDGVNIV